PPRSTPFPYTTLFRSPVERRGAGPLEIDPGVARKRSERHAEDRLRVRVLEELEPRTERREPRQFRAVLIQVHAIELGDRRPAARSEEHTSELQSRENL